ncbi:hypothetical protein [Paenibacillus sp. RC67]|uniref:hypothetical protein n=1 Tax=Paenibacillus sp. RC67 TaxID=3039392 RepID=UPI0024AE8794|nr:hypothetical protein [Paenibacillus sp. RC67]
MLLQNPEREDNAMWTDEMLKQHEEFAQWLIHNADTAYNPPMPTIETTSTPPSQIAEQIKRYVLSKWNEHLPLNHPNQK